MPNYLFFFSRVDCISSATSVFGKLKIFTAVAHENHQ